MIHKHKLMENRVGSSNLFISHKQFLKSLMKVLSVVWSLVLTHAPVQKPNATHG